MLRIHQDRLSLRCFEQISIKLIRALHEATKIRKALLCLVLVRLHIPQRSRYAFNAIPISRHSWLLCTRRSTCRCASNDNYTAQQCFERKTSREDGVISSLFRKRNRNSIFASDCVKHIACQSRDRWVIIHCSCRKVQIKCGVNR